MRNILMGCETFTQIQRGAPGISRSLLAQRLAALECHGITERRPLGHGRGYRYLPTETGRDLWSVLVAAGEWAPAGWRPPPSTWNPTWALL
ncbi:helix-turn-helix domain-containing protein [Streptomyces sp. ISL-11]|uniref:winged helix-turn-helix transcriptional regulator n=1 Tax=Streptomyces sp. ISL-11 TaxID=2819174 RepID=UPI001BE55366|nr:winged helix-turn-helix transcriptional regulator [Streptomyces sp. ISL-11]MBT2384659.1 winged helix-turn-helix transcriptional regulator [Streptomyces sp. ISL-11]